MPIFINSLSLEDVPDLGSGLISWIQSNPKQLNEG